MSCARWNESNLAFLCSFACCCNDTGILAGMLHLPAAAAAALSPASLAAGAHLDLSSMACLPPGLSTPPAFALHTRRTCARMLGVPNICGDVASLHISLVAAPSRLLAHTSRSMAAAASSALSIALTLSPAPHQGPAIVLALYPYARRTLIFGLLSLRSLLLHTASKSCTASSPPPGGHS